MNTTDEYIIAMIDSLNRKIRYWNNLLKGSPGSKKYCRAAIAEARQVRDAFLSSLVNPQ